MLTLPSNWVAAMTSWVRAAHPEGPQGIGVEIKNLCGVRVMHKIRDKKKNMEKRREDEEEKEGEDEDKDEEKRKELIM